MLHSAPQRHGQQKVQHHEQIHSRQQALISVIGQRINVTSAQLRMIDIEQSYHLIQQEEQPADSSGKHRPKTLANTIKLIYQPSITYCVAGIYIVILTLESLGEITRKSVRCPSRTEAFWWEQFRMMSGRIWSK